MPRPKARTNKTKTVIANTSGTTWETIVLGSKTHNCCLLCGGLITSARKTLLPEIVESVLSNMAKNKIHQHSAITRFTQNIVDSAYAVDVRCTEEDTVNFYACACCHYWFERRRKRKQLILPLVLLQWYFNTIHVEPLVKCKITKNRSFDLRVCKRMCTEICRLHGPERLRNVYWDAFTKQEQDLLLRLNDVSISNMLKVHVQWMCEVNNNPVFFHSSKVAELMRGSLRGIEWDAETDETSE